MQSDSNIKSLNLSNNFPCLCLRLYTFLKNDVKVVALFCLPEISIVHLRPFKSVYF